MNSKCEQAPVAPPKLVAFYQISSVHLESDSTEGSKKLTLSKARRTLDRLLRNDLHGVNSFCVSFSHSIHLAKGSFSDLMEDGKVVDAKPGSVLWEKIENKLVTFTEVGGFVEGG